MSFKAIYKLATILAIVCNAIAAPWQDYQSYPDTNYKSKHLSKAKRISE